MNYPVELIKTQYYTEMYETEVWSFYRIRHA